MNAHRSRLGGRIEVAARAIADRSARRAPPADPRRILIAHHLLLGDTLMVTALVAKLSERHPAADIAMMVPHASAGLYATRPYGVRAIAWDTRAPPRALFGEAPFDLAFVPGDNRFSWLAAAMGARWIVAFAGDRPGYKSWPVDELRDYPAVPTAWGDAVAGLIDGEEPRPYSLADWPEPAAGDFARPATPYAVLHVGASTPLKLWPPERWLTLARKLEQAGLCIVWSGGRGEQRIVESIDPLQSYVSYAGRLDLAQLWHLVAGAALLTDLAGSQAHAR